MATNKASIKTLAQCLMQEYSLSKADAERFVQTMFEIVNNGLRNDKLVKVKGLGTFKVMSIASRRSIDVNTGEPIVIEGRDKISYIPDAQMRDLVNRPFAQFETVVVNDGVDFSEIDKKFADKTDVSSADIGEFLRENKISVEEDKKSGQDNVPEQTEEESTESKKSTVKEENPSKEEKELPNEETAQSTNNTKEISANTNDNSTNINEISDGPLRLTSAQLSVLNGQLSGLEENDEEPLDADENQQNRVEEPERSHAFKLTQSELRILNEPTEKEQQQSLSDGVTPRQASEADTNSVTYLSKQEEKSVTSSTEETEKRTEVPAAEQQEIAEEQKVVEPEAVPVPTMTDELKVEINRTHRLIRWMAAGIVLLVVVSAATMIYLFSQLDRRDNRIRHLETTSSLAINKKAVAGESVNKAALARSRADSVRITSELAQLDTLSKTSATKASAGNTKVGASDRKSIAAAKPTSSNKASKLQNTKQTVAKTESKVNKQTKSNTEDKSSIYDKDPRVRTGAYRIIGIDHLLTVRKGQTLHSITRSTLGPGMECYIEAVNNGRTEFKEGEKIKIPKLKLKRKK
ncbi:MAG: HU family DNA-binding protein [Prevotella sp.]|jgi:nucleoid DNA-binding protein